MREQKLHTILTHHEKELLYCIYIWKFTEINWHSMPRQLTTLARWSITIYWKQAHFFRTTPHIIDAFARFEQTFIVVFFYLSECSLGIRREPEDSEFELRTTTISFQLEWGEGGGGVDSIKFNLTSTFVNKSVFLETYAIIEIQCIYWFANKSTVWYNNENCFKLKLTLHKV